MSALFHKGSSFDGSRQKNNAWPVDARMLRAPHKAQNSGRLIFDRQEDGRTKTGRAAIGTLSKRTERLVATYLATLGIDLHPEAVLFRNKSGNLYREDSLAHDFSSVRELAFPGDTRRLMDMRRSGVVEAIAGDAGPLALSAKLANSIQRSNALHRAYAPVDIEAVRGTDEARLLGKSSNERSVCYFSASGPTRPATAGYPIPRIKLVHAIRTLPSFE